AAFCAGCVAGGGSVDFAAAVPMAEAGPPPRGAVPMTPEGAYLSGRVAQEEHDFAAALTFYEEALAHDPGDAALATRVFVLAVSEGRFDLARPLASKLTSNDPNAGLANLVQAIELLKQNRASGALAVVRNLPDDGFYRFVGAFARAWLTLGDKGGAMAAVAELQPLGTEQGFLPLMALHAALIEDLADDDAAAERDYRAALGDKPPPLRLAQLAGNFYERVGKRDEADKLYKAFAENAGDAGVVPHVAAGGKPPRLIPDATSGLAEALFDLASVVSQADSPEVAMLGTRMALELKPDFPLATLMLGDLEEEQGRLPAALAVYRSIDPASPYAWAARLRVAGTLEDTGDADGAEKLLRVMAAERPAEAQPLIELGNVLRNHDKFREAATAYSDALTRLAPAADPKYWSLYYSRGIALERAGDWPAAEADLRRALSLKPDQADVMNYLGYSMVDRSVGLPEALKLIKRAVELKPKDGFIVDSLGWAYYRLGKYTDAESALEKAVELKPGDAEINDHLGDAYWQGGRREEARLQWRRALSLKPEPDLAKSIEAKLDHPPAQRPVAAVEKN
ncbi:MAG TPA: tetratricopeptide repeat protein, partial [Stellaceae bacterium]|nr:tetratricopeptide repeat protein [Stellaceae bacterium]